MAREVVIDTETTGLYPNDGHRIVEIGAVEIERQQRTGKAFQRYVNPQRPVPADASRVHGLTDDFLSDKEIFEDVVDAFLEFIGESRLIIHNAEFDMGFINHELVLAGRPRIPDDRAFDTLQFARSELPAAGGYSLDALCRYFNIDRSERVKHGALLDAELLAEVYIRLTAKDQGLLDLLSSEGDSEIDAGTGRIKHAPRPSRLAPRLTEAEAAAHRKFVESLGEGALWNQH